MKIKVANVNKSNRLQSNADKAEVFWSTVQVGDGINYTIHFAINRRTCCRPSKVGIYMDADMVTWTDTRSAHSITMFRCNPSAASVPLFSVTRDVPATDCQPAGTNCQSRRHQLASSRKQPITAKQPLAIWQ